MYLFFILILIFAYLAIGLYVLYWKNLDLENALSVVIGLMFWPFLLLRKKDD